MLHDLSDGNPEDSGAGPLAAGEDLARQQAIRQIGHRRRFWLRAIAGTVGMILLAAIWAITEYGNAGGWPTGGFGQSSEIPDVWNYWIIYPANAWEELTAQDATCVYRAQAKHRRPDQARDGAPRRPAQTGCHLRPRAARALRTDRETGGSGRPPRNGGHNPGSARSPAAGRDHGNHRYPASSRECLPGVACLLQPVR